MWLLCTTIMIELNYVIYQSKLQYMKKSAILQFTFTILETNDLIEWGGTFSWRYSITNSSKLHLLYSNDTNSNYLCNMLVYLRWIDWLGIMVYDPCTWGEFFVIEFKNSSIQETTKGTFQYSCRIFLHVIIDSIATVIFILTLWDLHARRLPNSDT